MGLVAHAGRGYARAAVRTRWLPLFRGARVPAPGFAAANPRAIEDRFVLKLLNWIDEVRSLSLDPRSGRAIEVRGREHLEGARKAGRGVVLVTGHFGFPPAIRVGLDAVGMPWLTLRQVGLRKEGVSVGEDLWARVRTLHRAREELGRNHACVLLADGGWGTTADVPFLEGNLRVSLGAFALGRVAACPVLPFFVPLDPACGLRVEIHEPLPRPASPGEDSDAEVARVFASVYATYVRRYPSCVYWTGG